MIYYIIAGLLLLIAALPVGGARSTAAWLMVVVLMVIGGLRFEVGTDWDSYQDIFNMIGQGESFGDLREENGFLLLIRVFHVFSSSYAAFIFTLFILSFSLKLYAITRFRADLTVSLIVYLFSAFLIYDLNGLRQGLAMGFVLCAGWFAIRTQFIAFLITITMAISIHMVAVVALPIYWLANISSLDRRPLVLKYIVAFFTVIVGYALSLAIANTDATVYLELLNLANRYDHYVEHFDKQFSPLSLGSLQRVFILVLALYMQSTLKCSQRVAALLVNSYLVATFIYFALSFNMEFMARASYYYKIFDVILISIMFISIKGSAAITLFICLLATLMFGSIYQILSIQDGGLLPYNIQFLR